MTAKTTTNEYAVFSFCVKIAHFYSPEPFCPAHESCYDCVISSCWSKNTQATELMVFHFAADNAARIR